VLAKGSTNLQQIIIVEFGFKPYSVMFMKLCCVMSAELKQQLVNTDEQVTREDSNLMYWKQFRDKGQHENDKTIHLLEQELVDMEASFTEISSR